MCCVYVCVCVCVSVCACVRVLEDGIVVKFIWPREVSCRLASHWRRLFKHQQRQHPVFDHLHPNGNPPSIAFHTLKDLRVLRLVPLAVSHFVCTLQFDGWDCSINPGTGYTGLAMSCFPFMPTGSQQLGVAPQSLHISKHEIDI